MTSCRHATLELLVERKTTMRCRRCHLTLAAEELGDGYCPECFDSGGIQHRDFEELSHAGNTAVRYRCEECGIVFTSS